LSLALVLLILLTRSQHFGTAFSPPDATLAAFFLAGLWVRSGLLMVLLLGVAALADQVAFANGISAWCVTAAYVFLIPTYASLWFAGLYCRGVQLTSLAGVGVLLAALTASTALAFAISSGSFFLFSGYFPTMSALEYGGRVLKYVPHYMGWAMAYSVGGVVLSLGWRALRPRNAAADLASH
jgi:hypothetical protein